MPSPSLLSERTVWQWLEPSQRLTGKIPMNMTNKSKSQ